METLKEALSYYWDDIAMWEKDKCIKFKDVEVVKKFSCGFGLPWVSWQEFGTHKNVGNWWLLKNGYAVGFNENMTSIGWSFPCKKLTKEQFEKYLNWDKTYEEYHNLRP